MWSITVKLNWNKTAGPFLIFPLGGFHAIGNTNHVISSSWREGFFFVTEEKRAGVFFFVFSLILFFSLFVMDFYQLRVGSRPNMRFRHVAPPLFQSRTSFVLHPVIIDETWVGKNKQETSSVGRMFEENLSVTSIDASTNLFTQTVTYLWQIEVKIFTKTHKSKVTSSPKTVFFFFLKKLKPNIKNYLNCKVSMSVLRNCGLSRSWVFRFIP